MFSSFSCYNFCLPTVYAFWQSPSCESKKSVQKLARLAARNSGCENSDSSTRRANIIPNSSFFFLTSATDPDYTKRERMFVKYILRGNSSCKRVNGGGGGPLVGCRLKFSYFVGSRLKFSIFVGCR